MEAVIVDPNTLLPPAMMPTTNRYVRSSEHRQLANKMLARPKAERFLCLDCERSTIAGGQGPSPWPSRR
jgi:hypothetical protein